MTRNRTSTRYDETMRLTTAGLRAAPSQVWGSVRLVPLIRERPIIDLRLGVRGYDEQLAAVTLRGQLDDPRLLYAAYVPHGLIVSWTDDGSPAAMSETWLGAARKARGVVVPGEARPGRPGAVKVLHRMVKREDDRRLRLLPLHLAMEGFLGLHFGGPDIAWKTWSRTALRDGLSPRWETAVAGRHLPDLADALRVFEIHDGQCGVLVFVGDALASAFVVTHPDDYRAVHYTLLEDFYGELLWHYGWQHRNVPAFAVAIDDSGGDAGVDSMGALADALARARSEWAAFDAELASGLLGRAVAAQTCRRIGAYTLSRFVSGIESVVSAADPAHRPDEAGSAVLERDEGHIGEAIYGADGTLAYLKTYRLAEAQRRRAHLLAVLAASDWQLDDAARRFGTTDRRLRKRLVDAGFGDLLRPGQTGSPR